MSTAETLMEQIGRELVEHPEPQMRQAGHLLLAACWGVQTFEGGQSRSIGALIWEEIDRQLSDLVKRTTP